MYPRLSMCRMTPKARNLAGQTAGVKGRSNGTPGDQGDPAHWLRGRAKRLIARRLGLDVKTVRNYVSTAEKHGLTRGPEAALTDEVLFAVVTKVYRRLLGRPRSEGWRWCASHDGDIRKLLEDRISVEEIRRILERRGAHVSASTLHRFIVSEFRDGLRTATDSPIGKAARPPEAISLPS
jgi:DNA-binding Lrp family transcriptional regulator